MALVDCSECGNQISDKAISCPHCGAPLASNLENSINQYGNNQASGSEETFMGRLFTYIKILVKCGVIFLVVFYLIPFFFSGSNDQSISVSGSGSNIQGVNDRPNTSEMTQFTAQEITDAYERNTVSADQQFKGKWILMKGVVASISTDISNDAYVTFDTANSFNSPRATFIKTENDELATLNKGQHIRALCIGNGDILKTPMLKDCTLVN